MAMHWKNICDNICDAHMHTKHCIRVYSLQSQKPQLRSNPSIIKVIYTWINIKFQYIYVYIGNDTIRHIVHRLHLPIKSIRNNFITCNRKPNNYLMFIIKFKLASSYHTNRFYGIIQYIYIYINLTCSTASIPDRMRYRNDFN